VTTPMRVAGILAYPPKMRQEILDWVKSLYATWAATRARVEIKGHKEDIKEFKADLKEATTPREIERLKDRIEVRQEGIDKASKILKEAIRDGAKGRGRKKSKRDFVTDLGGMPKNYPIEQLQQEIPKIRVGVEFTGQPAPRERAVHGTWNGNTKKLRILLHGRAPDQIFKYREAARTMDTIIKHELRHMVQQMFFQFEAELMERKILERGKSWEKLSPKEQEHIRKSLSRGAPKEYEVGSFALYEDVPKNLQYYLLPQEFFTWLGQSEETFLDEVRTMRVVGGEKDPRPKKKEFDQFVGNPRPIKSKGRVLKKGDPIATHPFFATLWEYDRKRWQRAVRELWKRVQNKLVLPPTRLPSSKRVAARHKTARMAERVAIRHLVARAPMSKLLGDLMGKWELLNRSVDEDLQKGGVSRADFLANRFKGLDEYDIRSLLMRLKSSGRVIWPHMLRAAKLWVEYLLQTKSIPRGQAKKFELSARPFSAAKRPPRDIVAWLEKNKGKYRYLVDAAGWPDKVENGIGGAEDLFTVGPFKVHNTVRETGGQPRTLAWYNPNDDKLYLRPHIKVGEGELHNFLHELGHRYWDKIMSRDVKTKWANHYSMIKYGLGQYERSRPTDLPEIGEPLPIPMQGMRRGGPPIVTDIDDRFIHVLHKPTGRDAKIKKREYWKFLERRAKRGQFPTPYASTNREEHFCEALAMHLLGNLPEPHKSIFDTVVIKGEDPPGMPAKVARMYLAKRFTPEAWKEYKRKHPKADPKRHEIVQPEKGKAPKPKKTVRQKLDHVFTSIKGLSKSVAKSVREAPEKVQKFIVDKSYRDDVTKAAAKTIKEAPGKIKTAVIQSGKAELKAIFKETPRILATLAKERRAPTKAEAKTLYGVGVYVAGTVLAMTTGGPAGGAIGRVALAGAKAFGHSLSLHIGIKAMNQFADEGFLAYEAAESVAQAGGISAVLPVSTSALPGLGQIWDAVSKVVMASEEKSKSESAMDKMIEQLIRIIGEELDKGLTDDEIVKILKEERP